jgi:hypothetical protein
VKQCKIQIYYYSGVIDTGIVILTGVNDTAVVCLTGVVDTGEAPKIVNISTSFQQNENFFLSLRSGPRNDLIHERKKLSKIS